MNEKRLTQILMIQARQRCQDALQVIFDDLSNVQVCLDQQSLLQLREAPRGTEKQPTIYVWHSDNLDVPLHAAYIKYNRLDLLIVKTSWLLGSAWIGQLYSGLVIDHNTRMTEAEWLSVAHIKSRIR